MKIFLNNFIKFVNYLLPKRHEMIFLSYPDFSGNSKALYDYMIQNFPQFKYIWLLHDAENETMLKKNGISVLHGFSSKGIRRLLSAKVIISDHMSRMLVRSKKQIYVNLWHGIPLKAIGYMDKSDTRKHKFKLNDSNSITISTSKTVNSLFAACLAIKPQNLYITGQPRNDKLFSPITTMELSKLVDIELKDFDHVVFYMPTFRQGYINRKEGRQFDESNIFGFENFERDKFSSFLEENRILFLCKLHPFEEKLFKYKLNELGEYVTLITNDDLFEKNIDLYSLIAKADILVTDYSSVYFDFLLLNKPIIFTPTDIEEYRKKRGFVLEPYDFWAPGPKVITQEKLQNEIIKSIENPEYYKEERKTVNNIINHYKDDRSSERVAQIIMNKINR